MVSLFNELAYHTTPNCFLSMLAVRRNRRTCYILSNLSASIGSPDIFLSNIGDGFAKPALRNPPATDLRW